MAVGDMVVVGVGPVTQFNSAGIVRITGDYRFDSSFTPHHRRPVEILKAFDKPVPSQRFSRASRLELIPEEDFFDALISFIK